MFAEIFVDVRTPEEIELLSIDSTHHIEWQEILNVKEIASFEDKIYLFCRSGVRSENAKNILLMQAIQMFLILEDLKKPLNTLRKKGKILKIDAT